MAGPTSDRRDAKAAFEQLLLHTRERPIVGEALAAVIAGEDDYCIAGQTARVERLQHSANVGIQALHHRCVGPLRATVAMDDVADSPRLGLVVGAFPWPMGCGEMEAEQKRL